MSFKIQSPQSVVEGGTGAQTFTSNGVLLGNTTSAVTATSAGNTGEAFMGNTGMAPSFQSLPASSISLTGDSGGALSGAAFTVYANNATKNAGSSVALAGSGSTLTLNVTDGNGNTMIGQSVGNVTLTGIRNTIIGSDGNGGTGTPGVALTTGSYNTVVTGAGGGASLTTGQLNLFFGYQAAPNVSTGSSNLAIGESTGGAVSTGNFNCWVGDACGSNGGADSSNTYINCGFINASESNTLRIGAGSGAGSQQLSAVFVSGIYGVTTASATVSPVLVSDGNQLGTIASSIRFKEDVEDMDSSSSAIMQLRPVTFQYKAHTDNVKQYGLIAEEVQDIMPGIVNLDQEGKPFTVRYHDLVPMLLNELQKLAARVAELEAK